MLGNRSGFHTLKIEHKQVKTTQKYVMSQFLSQTTPSPFSYRKRALFNLYLLSPPPSPKDEIDYTPQNISKMVMFSYVAYNIGGKRCITLSSFSAFLPQLFQKGHSMYLPEERKRATWNHNPSVFEVLRFIRNIWQILNKIKIYFSLFY